MENKMNTEEYIWPGKLSEASLLLKKERSLLVAGGTSLRFRNLDRFSTLVDISRIIPKDIRIHAEKVHFGAMCRISDILANEELANINCGIFHRTAENIGTTALRNQISVGGNISMVYRWSDLPVTFLCLNGKINTFDAGRDRTYSAMDFFKKQPVINMSRGELVTGIDVPILKEHTLIFNTFCKTKGDFAAIDIAVGYRQSKIFEDARIAVSAVSSLPRRLVKLEKWLQGKARTKETVIEGLDECLPLMGTGDLRYGSAYLNKVLKVMLKRALLNKGGKPSMEGNK